MKILLNTYNKQTIPLTDDEIEKIYRLSENGNFPFFAIKYIGELHPCPIIEAKKCYEEIIEKYDKEKTSKIKEILS